MKVVLIVLLAVAAVAAAFYFIPSSSEKQEEVSKERIRTPEEQLAGFIVPDGFVVELVASEKDGVVNPIDITFDDAGRIWTQTAIMYPMDPIADIQWDDLLELMNDQEAQKNHPAFKRVLDLYQGKTKGIDKILILSDFYGNNKVKSTVWADSLTIPMSILPYKNGAYVAQGSELFFLDDKNKDGKADERVPLLTGFGFTDSHTMSHVLMRGPGNWLHFSHGALNKGEVSSLTSDAKLSMNYSKIVRMSPDGKKVELVNAGLNNIWGFQLRHNGQWYLTEANDLGYSIVPAEPGSSFPGIGNEKLRPYQPFMPALHEFRVGGTGISGLAFADDQSGGFPDEWKDVALLANPITSTINAVKVVRNPDGTVTASHLPDLLTSKDKYFRPVNMEFGPDGCLYVVDWYNKIISHNEIPTTDPERDKDHGRIWRIRHKSQKPREVPDFYKMPTENLVDHLKSPSLWAKRAAWHQIADRPAAETKVLVPALLQLARDKAQDEVTRIHALWSLESIKHYEEDLIRELLSSDQDNLRREAVRSLSSFGLPARQVATFLQEVVEDKNVMVRSQVLRTLADLGTADSSTIALLIQACKPELPGNKMGGSYERRFERYLALKALEQYPQELYSFLNSSAGEKTPALNRLWAVHALPAGQKENLFIRTWPQANMRELGESDFVAVSDMLKNKTIYGLLKPVIGSQEHGEKYVRYALQNQQAAASPELSGLLQNTVIRLLKDGDEDKKQLALDAFVQLNTPVPLSSVQQLIKNDAEPRTIQLVVQALEKYPGKNKAALLQVIENDHFDDRLRMQALRTLAAADPATAEQLLASRLPALNAEQKQQVASIMSSSRHGSNVLIALFDKKLIGADAFRMSAAERVYESDTTNSSGRAILTAVKQKHEEEQQAFKGRLSHYMAIAEKKSGDADKGKKLFETCLMCHKVGDKGQSIAPALDGSASRDTEALLTAILNPDAAVEGGYAIYRVVKKDNSTLEGYLFEKNDKGTTVAFMGGTKSFVAAGDIKDQGFLGGRSFMPRGLIDNYSDQEVADLLAHIQTLK